MAFEVLTAAELATLLARRPLPEEFGPGSRLPLLAITLAGADEAAAALLQRLPCPVIGIGEAGDGLADLCDILLPDTKGLDIIAHNVGRWPLAAMILVQHLRASAMLPASAALTAESFAYATLQQGPEFRRWLAGRAGPVPPPNEDDGVLIDRDGDRLRITLDRPRARNAISIALRDALAEALDLALADSGIARVELAGAGDCFCVGGDIAEFGRAPDPATAHHVRSLRLPARRLEQLADRLHVHVQGAAIGAGIEMAAFASRLTAKADAWFQLPELKYGLIPGAGGTVSLARRIGRQRTAYLALSMRRLRAPAALAWGLIDGIV